MFASDVTATQNRKANVTFGSGTGLAVAHDIGNLIQIHLTATRRGFAKCQRGTRWGVQLVVVMRLSNFDIPAACQLRRHLFNKLCQQCPTN